jgi:hypothetical protein
MKPSHLKAKPRKYIMTTSVLFSLIAAVLFGLLWRFWFGPHYMLDAIHSGDVRKVALLTHLGMRPNSDLWLIGGIMQCAAASGQTQVMAKLLELGANVNRVDGCGRTPADAAVVIGQTNSLRWLLAHGADPSIKNRDGYTVAELITNSGYEASLQAALLAALNTLSNNPSGSAVVPR